MRWAPLAAILLLWLGCTPRVEEADVVVYGATPAGIAAAVSSAREGRKVVLVAPTDHLGGMMSSGLSWSDTGDKNLIGGFAREVFERIGSEYGDDIAWRFEPHVAKRVFRELLRAAGVPVRFGSALTRIERVGKELRELGTTGGRFRGRIFVDASYEGDLMAAAGVPYRVGREARSEFRERHAGTLVHNPIHQFPTTVDPLDETGGLLPGVHAGPLDVAGTGDRRLPAYNFRVCLTAARDQLPFSRPRGYDARRYELLGRTLRAEPEPRLGDYVLLMTIPGGKWDANTRGPFSTDWIGANHAWAEAGRDVRAQLREAHEEYTRGFFYFLSSDPGVPESMRNDLAALGYCADEFVEHGNWPPQLYVREARRMVGAWVLREGDLRSRLMQPDSIGVGSHRIESHHVQRVVGRAGAPVNEGYLTLSVPPYEIPWRSLVPQSRHVTNLIVPVAVSATHVAFSSLRVEPVFLILGHAAGLGASLAIESGRAVQEVEITELQRRLRAAGQILRAPFARAR